jgi:hypothetical protein
MKFKICFFGYGLTTTNRRRRRGEAQKERRLNNWQRTYELLWIKSKKCQPV